jgi:hypothetical protein
MNGRMHGKGVGRATVGLAVSRIVGWQGSSKLKVDKTAGWATGFWVRPGVRTLIRQQAKWLTRRLFGYTIDREGRRKSGCGGRKLIVKEVGWRLEGRLTRWLFGTVRKEGGRSYN